MSIDPTSRFTNHVNPTQQTNNNGGGLGGGSASSYKKDDEEEQNSLLNENVSDEFTSSQGKEITDDLADKSTWDLFKEFIGSIGQSILNVFGIKKDN